MPQNHQNNLQGFGWFGGSNQYGNQFPNNNAPATFPKTPSLFLPNFVPPVYFPNNYPYPNFNSFPFAPNFNNNGNGQSYGQNNGGGQNPPPPFNNNPEGQFGGQNHNQNTGGQHPQPSQVQPHGHNHGGGQNSPPLFNNNPEGQFGGQNNNQNTGGQHQQPSQVQPLPSNPNGGQNVHNQLGAGEDKFLTNAFFGNNAEGTNKINRHWTPEDEARWQATTKAPYFENKVPGLECTLPASAVLGTKDNMKMLTLNSI